MNNILKRISTINYLIIPIGVSINVVGYQLSQILRFPILLDSIGTILSGVLGGPVIGILTGVMSTCVNSLINPISFAYILTSLMIGLCAGVFGHFRMMNNIIGLIFSGIILSIITTIFSGIITFYLFQGATGGTSSLATISLYALGNSLVKSVFSVQLVQEFADKFSSIVIVYLILKVLPNRFIIKLENGEALLHGKTDK